MKPRPVHRMNTTSRLHKASPPLGALFGRTVCFAPNTTSFVRKGLKNIFSKNAKEDVPPETRWIDRPRAVASSEVDARARETETETETETSEESGDVDVERAIGDDDARRRARGGWWTAFARDARAGRRRTPRARARGDVRERQAESVGERER